MANVGTIQTPGAPDKRPEHVDETVTISKSDLADMMRRLNAIEARAVPPPGRAEAQAALPDQSEIDPAKIKDAVLSKQGWVLPLAPAANAGKV
jgi:hypothetical protein